MFHLFCFILLIKFLRSLEIYHFTTFCRSDSQFSTLPAQNLAAMFPLHITLTLEGLSWFSHPQLAKRRSVIQGAVSPVLEDTIVLPIYVKKRKREALNISILLEESSIKDIDGLSTRKGKCQRMRGGILT